GARCTVAVTLSVAGAVITCGTGRLASRLAGDSPKIEKWGWSGLVSQAGLALGLAASISSRFPTFGNGFRALAIATVALNEMFGPILFKLALDRTGESSVAPAPVRPSLMPRPHPRPS